MRGRRIRHCEAAQRPRQSIYPAMDCFAALAMTEGGDYPSGRSAVVT